MVDVDGHGPCGAGNSKLSRLIPRFLRLSALVAAELGTEAKDEEEETKAADTGMTAGTGQPADENASTSTDGASDAGSTQGVNRLYEIAFRPTREWYMLLAGLLTRAVLEGYLTAGWRGLQATECLMTVGLGMEDRPIDEGQDEQFKEVDPDDLPTLTDAVKLLFPSLRDNIPTRKGLSEDEYEIEMYERLRKFYDVRQLTPDLETHMEDLAWQYPAEPVERAALRFCEAIAKWRGKPELETYKKKPAPSTPGMSSMSIESLVHSNPTSPAMHQTVAPTPSSITGSLGFSVPPAPRRVGRKPSIDVYFTPPTLQDSPWVRPTSKRPRSASSSARMQESPTKRIHI
ncbi:hypothetical protein AX15_001897 [Amanita polypyramis BW_CC]|nr:hypothetical protein AX15_001897 [Amanita polypyramis BW_CC]